uniref:Ferritin-like domain-containing protein n=1 Tax=Cyanothece sp. (strain PCC 7425 / ATCC 29141) TaxID=395961 RepID=B8HV31_CYAP4
MKIGSEAHKELFCHTFLDSYLEYEPEHLPWPNLDQEARARLQSIPFWGIAIDTEHEAGTMLAAYAETISDPLLRAAITLQAKEEARHCRLIQTLVCHYDIAVPERPVYDVPANLHQTFVNFGYMECIDSFLAFGMFRLGCQSGFVPTSLTDLFEPLLDEEARHIVFFVNAIAYLQIQQGRRSKLWRDSYALLRYGRSILRQMNDIRRSGNREGGFTATGISAISFEVTPVQFLATCLAENRQRMSQFDPRLLQPQFLPQTGAAVYRLLEFFSTSNNKREYPPALRDEAKTDLP